jgi:hypothetical protein
MDLIAQGESHTYTMCGREIILENCSSRDIYVNFSSDEGLPLILVALDETHGLWRTYTLKNLHLRIDDNWLKSHSLI